jgi:hypothetical protein
MRSPTERPPEPPHNIELEHALLGALFITNAVFQHVSSFLRPEHFYEPLHGKLFEISAELISAGKIANPITLKAHLPPELKKLKISGLTIYQYLARLVAEATTVINAADYARGIVALARRRRIMELAEDFAAAALDDDDPELATRARDAFGEVAKVAALEKPLAADDFMAYWHGDVVPADSRPWLVYGTIPETGSGLLAGQWGTFKTFTAIDIACAVMSGTPIFGSEVDRRGGVLLYAAEGQSEVPIRLQASINNRCSWMTKTPFTWLTPEKLPLNLLDPDSVRNFIARARQVDAEMRRRFDLPLALIEIDTVVTTAGFKKPGDEDDAVVGAQLVEAMKEISRQTGAFVLGVDHFGKSAETGTRGSSAKESNVDVVLATLGDKSISGVVTNPRLAVRKVRGGIAGREYHFTTTIIDTKVVDSKLRPITTLTITWSEQSDPVADTKDKKKDPWSKSLRLLRRVLMNLLVDRGVDQHPYPDGPIVRAVDKEVVRAEFYKDYPADGETAEKKQVAKNKAFNRAIKDAQAAGLIGVREIELNIQYIWLAKAETPAERSTAP